MPLHAFVPAQLGRPFPPSQPPPAPLPLPPPPKVRSGAHATLRNVHFSKMVTDSGGAAITNDGGVLIISGCTFMNTRAVKRVSCAASEGYTGDHGCPAAGENPGGGAVINRGRSRCLIRDSSFTDCVGNKGGAVYTEEPRDDDPEGADGSEACQTHARVTPPLSTTNTPPCRLWPCYSCTGRQVAPLGARPLAAEAPRLYGA